MLNIQSLNPNEVKQQYRKLSMDFQNDPVKIESLNREYQNYIETPNQKQNNGLSQFKEQTHEAPVVTSSMPRVWNNSQVMQGFLPVYPNQQISEPQMMIFPINADDEAKMMKTMMNSMPDILNMAFDMKKKYNMSEKSKKENSNILESFMDYLSMGTESLPEHFHNMDDYNDENYQDIDETIEISIYDIFNESNIQVNYKSKIFQNYREIEEVNNSKIIKLTHNIEHNQVTTYNNDGNKYIIKNNVSYSKLNIKFVIKENNEYEQNVNTNNLRYLKNNSDYHIHINISYPESILGFSRTILLLNQNETTLNVNSNGKIILNGDKKKIKGKGFCLDGDNNYGDIIIHFHVNNYEIVDFNKKKDLIKSIFNDI